MPLWNCAARVAVLALLLLVTAAAPPPRRVLFIGNSLTYVNDLPAMLETVARSRGIPIETRFCGGAGMTLRQHWEKGEAQAAIRARHYDFVVLQPQSSEHVANPQEMHRYARLFNDAIRRTGAKTVLFVTWTPRPWNGQQPAYNRDSIALTNELGAISVPVGMVWPAVAAHHIELYADVVHANVAGTYAAACTFFAKLTGTAPIGAAHPREIDDATAGVIQKEAWEGVRRWR